MKTGAWATALVALSLVITSSECAKKTKRPNFVIIMADDLGYNDLGYMGNTDVETPNLNQLAKESVHIENFYSHPVCAPTRASLLTGRHFLRTGVWGVHGAREYLNLDETTWANALQWAGYKTGMFGKWHSGATDGYLPWDRGFGEACMVALYDYFDNAATCNGKSKWAPGWVTERVTDWAIDFIEQNRNDSFAVYIPFMAPHLGKTWYGEDEFWHAPQELVDKYKWKGYSEGTARLYGMIEFMDHQVGRVMWRLDDLGLGNDTVVMFFSDNGPTGNWKVPTWEWDKRNAHHLKGIKGDLYDNGIKVPFFVRWRSKLKPAVVKKGLAQIEDIYPTILHMANATGGSKPLDGKNMWKLLKKPAKYEKRWIGRQIYRTIEAPEWTRANGVFRRLPGWSTDKSALNFEYDGRWSIREGRWKFITNGAKILYDMWNDPTESTPVWDDAIVADLHGKLAKWWSGILGSGGSFSMPSFYVGWSEDSRIVMMGTVEASDNLVVRTHSVEGWVWPGTYMKFKVIVKDARKYTVKINKWGGWAGAASVNVVCNGKEHWVWGEVGRGDTVGNMTIYEGGGDCWMQFKIEQGSGWFQADILRLQHAL